MAAAAGLAGKASAARVAARTSSGRVERVEVEAGGRKSSVTGAALRKALGWDRVPSLAFALQPSRDGFVLEGRGSGHGAGLCQWGAAGRARAGEGYRRILLHYYPGTEILRAY
jgi:stage II sporulation protein D